MRDPYLYEDVDVLVNLGGIQDAEVLKVAEADVTAYTMASLYSMQFEKFDSQTLLEMHRIIFGDLYAWAGQIRTIQMTKSEYVLGGDTVRYAAPKEIKQEITAVCKEIPRLKKGKDREDLIFRVVRISAKLWQIHPFREGNTRTVVSFSMLLAKSLGLTVNPKLFEDNAAYVRNALVWASQGIYSKFEYLERIYFDAMGSEKALPDWKETGGENYSLVNGYYVANQKEIPHQYEGE